MPILSSSKNQSKRILVIFHHHRANNNQSFNQSFLQSVDPFDRAIGASLVLE